MSTRCSGGRVVLPNPAPARATCSTCGAVRKPRQERGKAVFPSHFPRGATQAPRAEKQAPTAPAEFREEVLGTIKRCPACSKFNHPRAVIHLDRCENKPKEDEIE